MLNLPQKQEVWFVYHIRGTNASCFQKEIIMCKVEGHFSKYTQAKAEKPEKKENHKDEEMGK